MPETARLATALGDRYQIERELGAGGMATVYLAKDLKHDRDVALKVLRPELAAVLGAERFLNEIKITARLDHPHILTLIDSGAADSFLYYVLPFVRGESLRDLLTREKQLGVEEALAITKQVASALDYAHRQGVVHRDIKPENILIQEGEAMLADFGIALAVKEAGGNRLTETGLSLGTPQYMSPEQATGDRQLDARSDVYSLAAVLYEMLAGEPPVTGPTVQAVIAKLLTERPTRMRIVRDTVPEGIDNAVAKALAKVPADRFPSAGDFQAALAAAMRPSAVREGSRPRWLVPVAAAAIVLAVAGGLVLSRQFTRERGPAFVVRDRTQATFSGEATLPAISADAKQLAYIVRRCERAACTYGIEVQDIGAGASRRVFDGATAIYSITLSPDRRFLLMVGTIANHYGSWILSTLGGTPRYVGAGVPAFNASGDSLFVASPPTDSIPRVWIATLDGERVDSFVVGRRGEAAGGLAPMTGAAALVVRVVSAGRSEWRLLDRHGRVLDAFGISNGLTGGLVTATSNAVWVMVAPPSGQSALVRLPVDAARGRFAGRGDTLLQVDSRLGVDVSADGNTIAYADGTAQFEVWGLEVADALRGQFAPERRLASSTSSIAIGISPDGSHVVMDRPVPGATQRVFSIVPFGGGPEVTHRPAGRVISSGWTRDGSAIAYAEVVDGRVRLVTADARTGVRRSTFPIADSSIQDHAVVGDSGWAWVPANQRGLRFQRVGESAPHELPLPAGVELLNGVTGAPDGRRIATYGWDATFDSLVVYVIELPSGAATRWASFFSESGLAFPLTDGSVLVANTETPVTWTLYRVRAPGHAERLGTIPRPVIGASVSRDGRRMVVRTRDFHGDIWLAHVAPAR
jgi:eukaryotic-like serine/threonine-protein kinase